MVLSKWMRNFPCFNTRSKFKKFILFDCIWKSTKSLNFHFQVSNIGRPHPQSLIYNFIVRVYLSICCCLLTKWVMLCSTLCDPIDCSLPGSSVHWISQAKILEWFAISFSRASSPPRDWSYIPCIGRWILYYWATWEAPFTYSVCQQLSFSFILPRVCSQQYHLASWIVFHCRLLINRY